MRSVSALLLALAASAASNPAAADFTVSPATTTQSGSSFVRQWTLSASNSSASSRFVDQIKVEAPGQVFIRYLSGQAAGVAGFVNVTSSVSTVVDAMAVRGGADADDSDDETGSDADDDAELHVKFDSTAATDAALVTEIFLTQQSAISELKTRSSADVVVEAGVVVVSGSNEDLQIEVQGSGSVYVSDAAAAIRLKEFQATVSGAGSLQIEVDSISLTEEAEFEVQGSGGISLFALSLSCGELNLDVTGAGTVCIAAETVTATSSDVQGGAQVSLPNSSSKFSTTGSATCSQATVPSQAARSAANSSDSTAGPSTPTAAPTPTPTPTSGASALTVVAAAQLLVAAVVATAL